MSQLAFRRFAVAAAAGCLSSVVVSCASRPTASTLASTNKFADATLRQIATAQDERATAALLPFLERPEAGYRREAALAFASVQDKAATAALSARLADADILVRRAAAYALGQTTDSTAENALRQRISIEADATTRRYVLEALGKCTSRAGLSTLTKLPAALATDTAAVAGQAWGLYRAGLRGLTSEAAVARVVQLLGKSNPYSARLAAANALARTRGLNLTPYAAAIGTAAQTDTRYEVRSAAAASLSKAAQAATVPATLVTLIRRDPDYRVRLSALRAVSAAQYAPLKEAAWEALTDAHEQVALTAAEFFLAHAKGEPGAGLLEKANKLTPWRVRATLLAAALRQGGEQQAAIRTAVQQRYLAAADPYEKGYLLKALGEDPAAYDFVSQATFLAGQPVVIGTYGIEALVSMRSHPAFPAELQPAFALLLQRAIGTGDVALMGTAAEALRNPKLDMRRLFANTVFLRQARDKLLLPRDLEAWQSLQQTIDFMENIPAVPLPVAKAATHPIDWGVVQGIPAGQRAIVHTGKGDITFRLLVEEAPGSVVSFVQLVRQGFYNGKNFHRVVPNFVAQGGCPRGDGWGSSDYNLRSEFADLHYGAGAVGLASAGKDTESCQWFITHAPTPHLDGRYTIFAQVVSGMDVVSRLEIGDRIERIELVR
ncbi:Peptidyl-prolyl cis-trans isomerase (rotamase)-cyclophilin family [Hymenobacter daecheongensis DSM 21074]|uniref:peptidylprolyl isomerase n=1 Tax=Hymenobacter daecheongensis DSM 21074 TaxID=1121955 RepID=A0A1M6GIN5_9BACT|nr:peptidylprolyl isomerase [Hymenobacter daecheongensis]SHJ09740.1 Peptidyl-prolyl cis-trans isomerase (rotamase)-cyclophilin family [Hymenobacter daecheongensis DSM 21074]